MFLVEQATKPTRDFSEDGHRSFLRRLEDSGDRGNLPTPFASLVAELFAAFRRERVVLRTTVIFCGLPFGVDHAITVEALDGEEQRTGIEFEDAVADLFDADGDAVAVHRLEGEGFED